VHLVVGTLLKVVIGVVIPPAHLMPTIAASPLHRCRRDHHRHHRDRPCRRVGTIARLVPRATVRSMCGKAY
jgi:hypothetical protein